MADPLSIIAGVAGVATAAVQASKGLYDLVDGIKDAADEIETISRDSHAFYSIVFSLQVELQDEDVRNVIAGDEGLTTMVGNLQRPLSNCSTILGQILVKIKGHVKPIKGGHRMSKSDLTWPLYKKGDVTKLVTQLTSTKATLVAGLDALCM